MKEKAVIQIEPHLKRLMRTLAQVQNRSVHELWEDAAREFLNKNYGTELRKEAKAVATLFQETLC